MRRVGLVWAAVLAGGVALLLSPSAAMSQFSAKASGRCCFMVSVDSAGFYTDRYIGTRSPEWKGSAEAKWGYSSRFIVGFGGDFPGNLDKTPTGKAYLSQSYSSSHDYVVLFQQGKQSKPDTCNESSKPSRGPEDFRWVRYQPVDGGEDRWAAQTGRVAFPKEVESLGFAPAVPIGSGVHHCGALVGLSALENAGFKDPDGLGIPAPSVKNWLQGTSFSKGCWQGLTAGDLGPRWVVVEAGQWLAVQFDYFPESQLKSKEKLLEKHFFHRQPTPSGVAMDTQKHLSDTMGDLENPPPGTTLPGTKSGCK